MNKKVKIALAVGIPVTLFGIYWFFLRKPNLYLNIDWLNNKGVAEFGGQEFPFRKGAGFGAVVKGRSLIVAPKDNGILVFTVTDKDGTQITQETIDFDGRLRY